MNLSVYILFFVLGQVFAQAPGCNVREGICQKTNYYVYSAAKTTVNDQFTWLYTKEAYPMSFELNVNLNNIVMTFYGHQTYKLSFTKVTDLAANTQWTFTAIEPALASQYPVEDSAERYIIDILKSNVQVLSEARSVTFKKGDTMFTFDSATEVNTKKPHLAAPKVRYTSVPSTFYAPNALNDDIAAKLTKNPLYLYVSDITYDTLELVLVAPSVYSVKAKYDHQTGTYKVTTLETITQYVNKATQDPSVNQKITDLFRAIARVTYNTNEKQLSIFNDIGSQLSFVETTVTYKDSLSAYIYEPGYIEFTATANGITTTYTIMYTCENGNTKKIEKIKVEGGIANPTFDAVVRLAKTLTYTETDKTVTLINGAIQQQYKFDTFNRVTAALQKYILSTNGYTQNNVVVNPFLAGQQKAEVALYVNQLKTGVVSVALNIESAFIFILDYNTLTGAITEVHPITQPNGIHATSSVTSIAQAQTTLLNLINGATTLTLGATTLTLKDTVANTQAEFALASLPTTARIVSGCLTGLTVSTSVNAYIGQFVEWVQGQTAKFTLISATHIVHYVFTLKAETGQNKYPVIYTTKTITYNGLNTQANITPDQTVIQSLFNTINEINFIMQPPNLYKGIQFVAGEQSITFNAAQPFTLASTAQTAYHPTQYQTTKYRMVAPTYFKNGRFEQIYTATTPDIIMEAYKIAEGQIQLKLDLVNTRTYLVNYQPHDGWVISKSFTIVQNPCAVPGVDMALETKVHDLFSQVQQLAFENDGTLQILAQYGSHRLSFKAFVTTANQQSYQTPVAFTNYELKLKQNGNAKLDTQPYRACMINLFAPTGLINFECSYATQANTYIIAFDPLTNVIKQVSTNIAIGTEYTELSAAIEAAKTLSFVNNKTLKFFGNFYTVQIALKSSTVTFGTKDAIYNEPVTVTVLTPQSAIVYTKRSLEAVPIDYILESVTGQASTQIHATGPVSIELRTDQNSQLLLTVNAGINRVQYALTYDAQVGQVHSTIKTVTEIRDGNYATDITLADKVIKQVKNVQVTAHGITLVTREGSTLLFKKHTLGKYDIIADSYTVNGQLQRLYDGEVYPMMVSVSQDNLGFARVTLYGRKMYSFIYKFQHHDGWVLERQYIGELPLTSTTLVNVNDRGAELKLLEIFKNVQQIAFEIDGQIQFLTNYGANRIVFKNAVHTPVDTVTLPNLDLGMKYLMPETYMKYGQYQALQGDTNYRFYILLNQAYNGAVNLTLKGIYEYRYFIEYQHFDGWVLFISFISKSPNPIVAGYTNAGLAVENQLIDLITNVQQIAFEQSGQVQFIKDNGATRVSFM